MLTAGLALAAGGCASAPSRDQPNPLTGAIEQPFRDLNLVRDDVPPPLRTAATAPYGVEGEPACERLAAEIAALDGVLGADVDKMAGPRSETVEELASGALRDALGLPFRGVVRRLTGAEKRDRALRHAVLSGMVRRGYLKGISRGRRC